MTRACFVLGCYGRCGLVVSWFSDFVTSLRGVWLVGTLAGFFAAG